MKSIGGPGWAGIGDGGKPVPISRDGDHPDLPNLLATLDRMAQKYGVDRSALAIAWLLAHPSGMIPIVGSTQPARLIAATRAAEIALSREDWYTLLIAARGERLP